MSIIVTLQPLYAAFFMKDNGESIYVGENKKYANFSVI